ncbi:membrane protein [Rhizobium leguminosarum bv. trifolii CB782]|nr:membrane protein [Rhizobium leguminosarum bv. trifolii CB782]
MREIIQTRSQAQFLRLAALLVVIVLGLALRRFGYAVDLPFVVVKYGGSALWGAMVYLLVALIVARSRPAVLAIIALFIAISVELFRLYHTPWLDAFRLTTAGALLLGRIFSLWNMLAYAIGIAAAWAVDPARRAAIAPRR